MQTFKPIKQSRISEEIVRQLKKAILSGTYMPGEKLPSERQLTEQFQTSRLVVREAIRELELTGFLKILQGPTGGAYVVDLSLNFFSRSLKDLFWTNKISAAELIQTRLYVEPEISRLAAVNCGSKDHQALNQALKGEEFDESSLEKKFNKRLKVDYLISSMCGNFVYQAIDKALLDLIKDMVMMVEPKIAFHFVHDDHVKIVEAVSQKNPELAAEATRKHILNMEESIVEIEKPYRRKKGLMM